MAASHCNFCLSARANLRSGEPFSFRVLFDGEPITGLRVSSNRERINDDGAEHKRADATGRLNFTFTAPGRWCVRTHYTRPHRDAQVADWESFWASLTFELKP